MQISIKISSDAGTHIQEVSMLKCIFIYGIER